MSKLKGEAGTRNREEPSLNRKLKDITQRKPKAKRKEQYTTVNGTPIIQGKAS